MYGKHFRQNHVAAAQPSSHQPFEHPTMPAHTHTHHHTRIHQSPPTQHHTIHHTFVHTLTHIHRIHHTTATHSENKRKQNEEKPSEAT